MSSFIRFSLVIILVLWVAALNAEDLIVGSTVDSQLGYSKTVNLSAKPSSIRSKKVYWSSYSTGKVIQGVSAIDLDKSSAKAFITGGGVGFTYVSVVMKSDHGNGLNYLVQIYV